MSCACQQDIYSLVSAAGLSEWAEQASAAMPGSVQAAAAGSECSVPLLTAGMHAADSADILPLLDLLLQNLPAAVLVLGMLEGSDLYTE